MPGRVLALPPPEPPACAAPEAPRRARPPSSKLTRQVSSLLGAFNVAGLGRLLRGKEPSPPTTQPPPKKVVLFGDTNAGKTALLRGLRGEDIRTTPTVGVDLYNETFHVRRSTKRAQALGAENCFHSRQSVGLGAHERPDPWRWRGRTCA